MKWRIVHGEARFDSGSLLNYLHLEGCIKKPCSALNGVAETFSLNTCCLMLLETGHLSGCILGLMNRGFLIFSLVLLGLMKPEVIMVICFLFANCHPAYSVLLLF